MWSLLTIVLLAVLCESPRGQKDLEKFARGFSQAQRRALGIRRNPQGKYPAPHQSTFCRFFQQVDGRKVEEALNILQFSPKGMAEDVRKVLASAVANAENNHNLDVDALIVAEASVGKSISMKRFATRARGRSSRIVKPFSQIRVVVREQEEA